MLYLAKLASLPAPVGQAPDSSKSRHGAQEAGCQAAAHQGLDKLKYCLQQWKYSYMVQPNLKSV